MKGHIRQRGRKSWEIKWDSGLDSATGKRRTQFKTVRGSKSDAYAALRAELSRVDKGTNVEPTKLTLSQYLTDWLDNTAPQTVAPKALTRYRGLVKNQITPHLGAIALQKLRPADVSKWLQDLIASKALSTRSIRHAHGVLRTALSHAAAIELVERNVATIVKAPTVERKEIEILTSEQMSDILKKLEGHSLLPVVAVALGTGARRGEIAALRWCDLDLDAATVRIERSIEDGTLRVKAPKTSAGRRTVSMPAIAVGTLRDHRRQQLEQRMALGIGNMPADAYVFGHVDGSILNPDSLSDRWREAVKSRKLPKVTFHALRHSHASALIAAGLDVVTVSKRLGHASPALTLGVYSHLFKNNDDKAAAAIDAALR